MVIYYACIALLGEFFLRPIPNEIRYLVHTPFSWDRLTAINILSLDIPAALLLCFIAALSMHQFNNITSFFHKCIFTSVLCVGLVYIYYMERLRHIIDIIFRQTPIWWRDLYYFSYSRAGNTVEVVIMFLLFLAFAFIILEVPQKRRHNAKSLESIQPTQEGSHYDYKLKIALLSLSFVLIILFAFFLIADAFIARFIKLEIIFLTGILMSLSFFIFAVDKEHGLSTNAAQLVQAPQPQQPAWYSFKDILLLFCVGSCLGAAYFIALLISAPTAQFLGLAALGSNTSFMIFGFIVAKMHDKSLAKSFIASFIMQVFAIFSSYAGRGLLPLPISRRLTGPTIYGIHGAIPFPRTYPLIAGFGELLHYAPRVILISFIASLTMVTLKSFSTYLAKTSLVILLCLGFIPFYVSERLRWISISPFNNVRPGSLPSRMATFTLSSNRLASVVEVIVMFAIFLAFIFIALEIPSQIKLHRSKIKGVPCRHHGYR